MKQRTLSQRAWRYAQSHTTYLGSRLDLHAAYAAGYRAAQRDQNFQKDRGPTPEQVTRRVMRAGVDMC